MIKLGSVDLEILRLGVDGSFNENNIEESDLNRLGVGRILDSLASLKDRNLLNLKKDGSFEITDAARDHLWNKDIPLWGRVLRLLEIKSFSMGEIANFLNESEQNISKEIEGLRKNQLVLMSPTRHEQKVLPIFEILEDGKELLSKISGNAFPKTVQEETKQSFEIIGLIDDIISDLSDQTISSESKEKIISKLNLLKEKINV